MHTKQIRSKFLEYFENNGHQIVPSSSLVPHNDPSLMFTTAGMVQFKNNFTGLELSKFPTAVSSQKCVRAGGKHNDLENVGYTARHHTFFEMLGNFSFGDYFKEHAIELAWNLLTKEFGINKDKLYITVYHTDDEAFKIWKKLTGFANSKIIKIDTNDNFWAMGDVGPCGPCSEIFYDHGQKYSGGLPGTAEADGDRFIEIWNLVFMQYEDKLGSPRSNLPKPSIDTGMGLERISAVLQGKNNNFEIDLFQNLIAQSQLLTGDTTNSASHKVIADHIRAISFLIADGVFPSNDGRGYVLRRIMRRAMRHVHSLIGKADILLFKMVPTLVTEMSDAYPELLRAQAVISSTIELEEKRFAETLDKGIKILNDETSKIDKSGILSGTVAFKLYDTYGFPLDLTCDVLRTKNVAVDIKGFEIEMNEQKKRARAAWTGSGAKADDKIWFEIADDVQNTDFLGYALPESEAIIEAIVQDGKRVEEVNSGSAIIILNQTPFYAESGGQVGDSGTLNENIVTDTKKYLGKLYGHHVEVTSPLKVNQPVKLSIDNLRRQKIKANHSATHLLHNALRAILGEHVNQKGSLVAADKLRFDFAHQQALTHDQVKDIENQVNQMIIGNANVATEIMTSESAMKSGAMALFGEKYGDEVRVVKMGASLELCGGTHVNDTGDIGAFKIISEAAIASGVRRIEALTGLTALNYLNAKEETLDALAKLLKCSENNLFEKISNLLNEQKLLEKNLNNIKMRSALKEDLIKQDIKDGQLLSLRLEKSDNNVSQSELRILLDALQKRNPVKSVIIITTVNDFKAFILISVSKDLPYYNANSLAKIASEALKGNGGGRTDVAQAGGNDIKLLEGAYNAILNEFKM